MLVYTQSNISRKKNRDSLSCSTIARTLAILDRVTTTKNETKQQEAKEGKRSDMKSADDADRRPTRSSAQFNSAPAQLIIFNCRLLFPFHKQQLSLITIFLFLHPSTTTLITEHAITLTPQYPPPQQHQKPKHIHQNETNNRRPSNNSPRPPRLLPQIPHPPRPRNSSSNSNRPRPSPLVSTLRPPCRLLLRRY